MSHLADKAPGRLTVRFVSLGAGRGWHLTQGRVECGHWGKNPEPLARELKPLTNPHAQALVGHGKAVGLARPWWVMVRLWV